MVLIESLLMPDDQLKSYLDNANRRGEISKPLAINDAFDLSLLKSLQ